MTNTLICNEENPVFCSLIPTNDAERAEVYNMKANKRNYEKIYWF